jgi:transposase
LFSYVDLEKRVRPDHPLRVIRGLVNSTLADLSAAFDALYSPFGRESIPPERLIRALLLRAFYSIHSERQLVERIDFDLLFRWFAGLGVDDPVWDATTFTKNRDRLLQGDVASEFMRALLASISRLMARCWKPGSAPKAFGQRTALARRSGYAACDRPSGLASGPRSRAAACAIWGRRMG